MDSISILDDKYLILGKKGFGATSRILEVRDKKTNKIYAAKIILTNKTIYQNEIEALSSLKNLNNPYIINLKDSGHGKIIKNNYQQIECYYIILEYATKGSFFKYIFYSENGLDEKIGKIFFFKILKGIKAIHSAGICHRDIKLENILLDENFTPKISDFGFATKNSKELNTFVGTPIYTAPEIIAFKKYDGIKADIFSLGVILIHLITGKVGFRLATNKDPLYRLIIIKHYSYYWNLVQKEIKPISNELKNLYIKMVSFKPDSRPSIDEILNDEWFKEIKELNEDEFFDLEDQMREKLLNLEKKIKNYIQKKIIFKDNKDIQSYREKENNIIYFDNEKNIKYALTGIGMEQFIKINGDLEPVKQMNYIANLIEKEFNKIKNICYIEVNENNMKFNVKFLNEEEEYKDKELSKEYIDEIKKYDEYFNIENNIEKKECVIEVKLFYSLNGGYLIRFVKKDGDAFDYYNNFNKIFNLIN